MLYLVATPIGNLSDFTFRGVETLKCVDYILCEDTRHSLRLLQHYQIEKPLVSYHKFNQSFRLNKVLNDLKEGKQIALISDAGTPGISDPGEDLVKSCIEHHLPVTAIPGPCAAIQAISCSGLPSVRFQFYGFLEKKENELKKELIAILNFPGTTICYESPHRLVETLSLLHSLAPERKVVVCRELTKKFEEIQRGTAHALINHWSETPPKGEIVLLIAPPSNTAPDWTHLSPEEHVAWAQHTYQLSKQEAIKLAASQRGVPKRQIYNTLIASDDKEFTD